jgi:hypothetical protein
MSRRLGSFSARRGVELILLTASRAAYGHKVSGRPAARMLQRMWVMIVWSARSAVPFRAEE